MGNVSQAVSQVHEQLKKLVLHAEILVEATRQKKPFNEGLVCLLGQTVYALEDAMDDLKKSTDNEDVAIDVGLIKNVLEEPLYPLQSPHKKLSLLKAATIQKETSSTVEMKAIILACALDYERTQGLMEDLKALDRSLLSRPL